MTYRLRGLISMQDHRKRTTRAVAPRELLECLKLPAPREREQAVEQALLRQVGRIHHVPDAGDNSNWLEYQLVVTGYTPQGERLFRVLRRATGEEGPSL